MTTQNTPGLGEIAYDGYRQTTDGKTWNGYPMPTWAELPEPVRLAWENAAQAVAHETLRRAAEQDVQAALNAGLA